MLRHALIVTPFLFAACASPLANPDIVGNEVTFSTAEVRTTEPSADPAPADAVFTQSKTVVYQAPPAQPPRRQRQRFSLKGGYLSSNEDGFDDGIIINGAWMRPLSDIVASEVEVGYMDASGSHKGIDRDVWAIPIMANGRVNVPLGEKLEVYGGLGLGWMYFNADADGLGVSVSGDGFLFAGDAYFGGDILLGESFRLGLEGKYYATDNSSDLDGGLDSYVVLLTLGFDR
ncbi:MAG TPA: outer membrane beta-barrel protein [Planctomycetota bacterium]|jgi:opacity protein-like surface antigen|nr:outer membrane beta-barrel protein [Planctomycetota bacterium]